MCSYSGKLCRADARSRCMLTRTTMSMDAQVLCHGIRQCSPTLQLPLQCCNWSFQSTDMAEGLGQRELYCCCPGNVQPLNQLIQPLACLVSCQLHKSARCELGVSQPSDRCSHLGRLHSSGSAVADFQGKCHPGSRGAGGCQPFAPGSS